MRKLKLYLDTSVLSFIFADDAPQLKRVTERFFEDMEKYEVYISEVVIREISKTKDAERRDRLLRAVEKYRLILLGTEKMEEVARLAQCYLEQRAIPAAKREDAEHIAYAVVHEIDILVSWNFRHIVHYDKIRQFNAVNLEKAYKTLSIYSPMEVTTYVNKNG